MLTKSALKEQGIIEDDTYRLFVPIEDHDLMKSVEVDENGDYIVQGVMSSEDKDEEDDSISPDGMDCSYFLDKGWIKYEHGNNPSQFIGEPIEVKVGQFEHPTLHKLVKGIHVKGRLFAQRELAKQAVQTIQDLQKSNTKRKMGWSIEGGVKERDRKTGKIIKSILRNVVLTMNPINTCTWAELAKSFAKNHELTIDMEKAMDIEGAAAITPQSIEGCHTEDEQEKWIKLFREFVRKHAISKSLKNQFIKSTTGGAAMGAYSFALEQDLKNDEAYEFANYIADNSNIIKSILKNLGGGVMKGKGLSGILDSELEELKKSMDNEEEEDEQCKKRKKGKGEEEEDEEEEDNEEEEDEEEDKTEKSFAKSFAANEENAKALEVSDFLANLADEIGYSIDGFSKSIGHMTKQQDILAKALLTMGSLVKSLSDKLEDSEQRYGDLQKSINTLLEQPVGRRSVVSQKELQTLQKGMQTGTQAKKALSREAIGEILYKSFEAGEIDGNTVVKFNAGGLSLQALNLPDSVKEKLGV